MEMRQVKYFLALSEELNFTRAAKRCDVSQPSLTRSIQLLEEEFGGRLFHREASKTQLSELGRTIKPHLAAMVDQSEAATKEARAFLETEVIRLKLGVMCTVAPTDLVQLLRGVKAQHPGVRLEVVDANSGKLEDRLRDGELDIAIVGRPEAEPPFPEFHWLPLYREQFVVVCHPEHRLAQLETVRCIDLDGEAYLRRVNCEMADVAGKRLRELGTTTQTVYRSDRDDWILAMTAVGLGVAFMPSRSVDRSLVAARPISDPEFWREVSLVTLRGRPHSAAVGALIHEAMRSSWLDGRAIAVKQIAAGNDDHLVHREVAGSRAR